MAATLPHSDLHTVPPSKTKLWIGRVLSALPVLFMGWSAIIKFTNIPPVVQSFEKLGLPLSTAHLIGTLELACVLLYAIPRTAVLGAILLTGYLGGAVLTHLRVGDPLFSHVLFPIYLGLVAWAGLYLREDRLRALVPLRA